MEDFGYMACACADGLGSDSATVVVALISLCSSVIIAKLNANFDIEKTPCLRKVKMLEKYIL